MKKLHKRGSFIRGLAAGIVILGSVSVAKAIPYASCITNLGGGNIQFFVNESGASVSVVTFPSGTSNVLSANMPAGKTNFNIGSDTSFQIYCTKLGNGTPIQITTDAAVTTNGAGATNLILGLWNSPRGVDIVKNPKIGSQFGRIFIGNSANGTVSVAGVSTNARGIGIYALNADGSDSYLNKGTNASFSSVFTGGTGSSFSAPKRLSVNPSDNTVDVADSSWTGSFGTAGTSAAVYKLDPDLGTSTVVLGPPGYTPSQLGTSSHGPPQGCFTTGSIAAGNLEVWTAVPDWPVPNGTPVLGTDGNGPTAPGNYNCVFRYDIGAGPLPWTNKPVMAANVCLPGFNQIAQQMDVSIATAYTNNVYAICQRLNYSDGTVQVFENDNGNILYDSLHNDGTDIFQTDGGNAPYGGIRVSPDGKYLATIKVNNVICVVNLDNNGLPVESSLVLIQNASNTGNARGLAFDAADNIYECSSGQGLLRGYSLGISATTITGNDLTGTNGTFSLALPPTVATVAASTPQASQNYTNAVPAGVPIDGVFTITLSTNNNANPVAVNISLTGTAVLGVNYTINSSDANGVTYASNLVTFPAGPMPGGGNWTANLHVTPTATPLIGPTLTVVYKESGGANYVAGTPGTATINIANTGPQYVFITNAPSGTTMNRGIPDDYGKFTLTRWGDTNGPGNNGGHLAQTSYTITNITYTGTANFTNDYGARAQRIDPTTPGVPFPAPTPGSPGIVIKPGDVTVTCIVGDPVFHTNVFLPPTNLTVITCLTNSGGNTNGTSSEGFSYFTTVAQTTNTIIDNTKGPETVLWSNPLTNALDNTWTLVYASTNQNTNTVPPIVVPGYTNTLTAIYGGGTGSNDFRADFGHPISSDSLPQSQIMAANGWTTALRVTANKDGAGAPTGINLYPVGQTFSGNIALRFEMYLSTYDNARGNPGIGSAGREFALFGVDHAGTNANWRPTNPIIPGTGCGPTNNDGNWFALDSGAVSLTPADYDGFASPLLPNPGTADLVSATASAEIGIFKNPPFTNDMSLTGGSPANTWVEIDLEQSQTTSNFSVMNINMFVDRSTVLTQFQTSQSAAGTTPGNYTNGTIMLGYEDPVGDQSDQSAFAYFSNVRVVELSPFVAASPASALVLSGSTVTLNSTATYSAGPGLTNVWKRGTTTPATAIITNTTVGTNFTDSLVLNSVTTGSNYWAVFTDAAGTSTSYPAAVEVVNTPANINAPQGGNGVFTVTASGQAPLNSFQWQTNGVNVANGTKYAGATTASLTVSNCQAADAALTYDCVVGNSATNQLAVVTAQTVTTPGASMTLIVPPSGAVVTPTPQTNLWGSPTTFSVSVGGGTAPFTYGWKLGATPLAGATKYSGTNAATLTISNITSADVGTYNVGVTNAAGNTTASGTLAIFTPQPNLSQTVLVSGGNVTMTYTTTNQYDTTNSFTLLSAPLVTGPYTNAVGATFATNLTGFTVVVPEGAATMFYRLRHVP
jgi:hypothetical protein